MRKPTKTSRGGARIKPLPRNVIAAADKFTTNTVMTTTALLASYLRSYWRLFPAQAIARLKESIVADLDRVTAMDPVLRNALRGSASSAMALASELLCERYPFNPMADLVMTALMRCALEGNAEAAVMMADLIGSCYLHHDRGPSLADSWRTFDPQDVPNTNHTASPPE